jgi:hypothetical protein
LHPYDAPMPAKNPRLTITIEPSLAAQLRRLSELTGNSQSRMIGELLEGSGPIFDRMIHVLEAAKTAKEAMRGKLTDDMEHAQSKMEGALGVVMEGFDQFTGSLLDEAEAVKRRARRKGRASAARAPGEGLGEAPLTPISNRGVRLDPSATKKIAANSSPVSSKSKKSGVKIRGGK